MSVKKLSSTTRSPRFLLGGDAERTTRQPRTRWCFLDTTWLRLAIFSSEHLLRPADATHVWGGLAVAKTHAMRRSAGRDLRAKARRCCGSGAAESVGILLGRADSRRKKLASFFVRGTAEGSRLGEWSRHFLKTLQEKPFRGVPRPQTYPRRSFCARPSTSLVRIPRPYPSWNSRETSARDARGGGSARGVECHFGHVIPPGPGAK